MATVTAKRKLKNSPKTVSDIGSITKQFTAAAILKLEMQGKLSTDDKITKYFQNVPPDKSDITIHQLLRHSSGLPGGVGGDYEKIGEPEFVEKVLPRRSDLPSERGLVLEYRLQSARIDRRESLRSSYEQYLYENLWKPAGMEMTGYTRPSFNKDLIAVGYQNDERWGKPTEKEWAGDGALPASER